MGIIWKLLICVVAVIAVLCQFEVPQNKWVVSKSIVLQASIEDSFKFVTSADYIDKWFPFLSRLKEADDRPLGNNKKYYAVYNLPLHGEYPMLYRITDYKEGGFIVVEGANMLRPQIEFRFLKLKEKGCKLSITITYRRKSVFFQYTLGPLLYFITSQKLQHSLFLLRMLFPY